MLHSIQPQVGTCVCVRRLSRREERVLHRARIQAATLCYLFNSVCTRAILDFIKEIGLLHKL